MTVRRRLFMGSGLGVGRAQVLQVYIRQQLMWWCRQRVLGRRALHQREGCTWAGSPSPLCDSTTDYGDGLTGRSRATDHSNRTYCLRETDAEEYAAVNFRCAVGLPFSWLPGGFSLCINRARPAGASCMTGADRCPSGLLSFEGVCAMQRKTPEVEVSTGWPWWLCAAHQGPLRRPRKDRRWLWSGQGHIVLDSLVLMATVHQILCAHHPLFRGLTHVRCMWAGEAGEEIRRICVARQRASYFAIPLVG